jgi:HemY protein
MRFLIWVIAIFALAAAVAMLADANQGYLLLVFPPYRMQVSLNLAIVVLLLSFIVAHVGIRLVSRTMDLPGRVARFRARRRQEKSTRSLKDGMRALSEGRYNDALRYGKIAYSTGGDQPVAGLIAARAAHALGDEKRYQEWLGRVALHPEASVARALMQGELALLDGNVAQADEALHLLSEHSQKNTAALKLELNVARANGDWGRAITALNQLRDHKALPASRTHELLREAYVHQLQQLTGQPERQAEVWREVPKSLQGDLEFLRPAVDALVAGGQAPVARKAVERALDAQWDSDLVRHYWLCAARPDEAGDGLSRAERWLVAHPEDANLLFSLGRQCMQAQIWGKAQSYLEQSLRLSPRKDVMFALGELMEKLERSSEATLYYRQAAGASTALVPV